MAKEIKKNKENSVEWYLSNRDLFKQLSIKVESIVREIIHDNNISLHTVNSRAKEVNSFAKKVNNSKYDDPLNQVTDLAGIRIIAYVEKDLETISKLIETNFEIDHENSIDKTKTLGTDKVGYRSIHYIAKLTKERLSLPEYAKFENLSFEIQIRTILQHAWAEIEHDKDYKFSGELPTKIKRRFKILSGVLELADREFDALADEIDKYQKEVTKNTKSGNLNIELNSTSLQTYMNKKFSEFYKSNKIKNNIKSREIIDELRNFDIENIQQLDNLITDNILSKISFSINSESTTTIGILRIIMMMNDISKYFENSWKKKWLAINQRTYDLLKDSNIDIDKYMDENDIYIHEIS